MQQPPTERLLSRQMCALFQHGSCEACLLTVVVLGQMTSVKIRCADEPSKINNKVGRSFMSPMEETAPGPSAEPLVSPKRGKSDRFPRGQWVGWAPQTEGMRVPEDESLAGINDGEGGLFSGILQGPLPQEEAREQQSPISEGSTIELDLIGHGIILNPVDESKQDIPINPDPSDVPDQGDYSLGDEPIGVEPADSTKDLTESGQKSWQDSETGILPEEEPLSLEHAPPSEVDSNLFDLEEIDTSTYFPPQQESKTADSIITTESGKKLSGGTLAWILVTVVVLSVMIIICFCCCCFLFNTAEPMARKTGSEPPNHRMGPGQIIQGSTYSTSPHTDEANAEYKRSQLLSRAARYGFESSNLSLSGQKLGEV